MTKEPFVSVIIITRNRPEMVSDCLKHLSRQTYRHFEIMVVDSSTDQRTKQLMEHYDKDVRYLFLPNGKNKMQESRNLGIQQSSGEIIAFLDDDSMAEACWVEQIVKGYYDNQVGAVGGLVTEPFGPPEEPANGRPIGAVLPNGKRITNYHLNPGKMIEADLVRGCNMSFRRSVLQKLGGFDPAYTGSNAFEAGDYCIRVRNAGYKVVFNPHANVLHVAAKREDIPRELTDPRSQFYNSRNWSLWVGKNLGWKRQHLNQIWITDTFEVFKNANQSLSKRLNITTASLLGKMAGTKAWLQWRYLGKKEPRLKI